MLTILYRDRSYKKGRDIFDIQYNTVYRLNITPTAGMVDFLCFKLTKEPITTAISKFVNGKADEAPSYYT